MSEPLRVNIPHPRRVEELRDEELDYLLGEVSKTSAQTEQLSDEELDALLAPYTRPGAESPEIVVTAPRVDVPAAPLTAGEAVAGGARELAGGALFEMADEAEAAARAPFSDKSYDEILHEIRQNRARFSSQYPGTALAANVAGGIGSLFVPGVGLAGKAAQSLTGISKLSSPLARTAASGSLAGAAAGFGAGEGLEDRLMSGAAGAGLGGVLGGGAYGAGRGAQFVRDVFRARGAGAEERAAETAADILAGRVAATGAPADLAARLDLERRYGVPTTIGTATPELATLAETVIREPSAARAELAARVAEQQAGAPQRVQQRLQTSVPTPDYFAAEESIINSLRRNADKAYGAAYAAAPEIRDPRIMQTLNDPDVRGAYMDALENSRRQQTEAVLRGEDPSQYKLREIFEPVLDEQGALVGLSPTGKMIPDMKTLDQIKQALDRRVTALYAAGKGGDATALRGVRDAFVERLDKVGPPEYRAARAQYKGDVEVRDALEQGRAANRLRWQEVSKLAREYTPGELEAFKTGFMQNLMKRFEDTSRKRNFADEIINTPNLRKSLQAITDPAEFSVLQAALKREAELFKAGSKVLGGSATFGRAAEKQAIEERVAAGDVPAAVDLLLNPTPGNIFRRTAQVLGNMRNANVSRATFNKLAEMLSAGSQAEVNQVLRALEAAAPVRAAREEAFERGATRAGVGAAKTVGPSPEEEKDVLEEPGELVIPDIGAGLYAMPGN